MTWLLANWRAAATVGVVTAALLASYGKGRADANSAWELKHQRELVAMYQAGEKALQRQRAEEAKILEAHQREIASIRNRAPTRGVFLAMPDSSPSGGTDGSRRPDLPVPDRRDIGPPLSAIGDEADLCAYRLNALQTWVRNATVPTGQKK